MFVPLWSVNKLLSNQSNLASTLLSLIIQRGNPNLQNQKPFQISSLRKIASKLELCEATKISWAQATLYISIFSKYRLNLIHKEVIVKAKPISKDFGDDFEDCIEKTNRSKLINYRGPLFLWNESNQSIIETTEIHGTIVELSEQRMNIWLDKIPKSLKTYNRNPSMPGTFSTLRLKTATLIFSSLKGPSYPEKTTSNLDKAYTN